MSQLDSPHAPLPRDHARAERPAAEPAPASPSLGATPSVRRRSHALETVLLASTAALLAAVAWPIAISGFGGDTPVASEPPPVAEAPAIAPIASPTATGAIQIALLLDTSSSMDGLIDQARSQLWRVVNAIDSVTWHGGRPTLEVALYEYGNDGLSAETGYIRQVSPFTVELDRVSEQLFSLRTNGGSEHAGQVIARSLDDLKWGGETGSLKVIYIAGNEEFAQGPVAWRDAIASARTKGVVVNTVNCATGGYEDPDWRQAAELAGGRFMAIDHEAVELYVAAPQDEEIGRLGAALNRTYVSYGEGGAERAENQIAQDKNSASLGRASAVQRAITKGSGYYANPTWDLVDAVDGKIVDLASVDRDDLPEEARSLEGDELTAWVDAKRTERSEIQRKLGQLATAREAYIASVRAEHKDEGAARLDDAIVSSILEQAQAQGFTVEPVAS